MANGTESVDTGLTAPAYAAALVCLRLLRALLANLLFAFTLVALIGLALWMVMLGAGAGWLLLDQPWLTTALRCALGILLIAALMVVVAVMAAVLALVYAAASRGSVAVGWWFLSLGILFLVVSGADLVFHAARVPSAPDSARGTEVFEAARDLWPLYIAVGFVHGSRGLVRVARGPERDVLFDHAAAGDRRVRFYRLLGIPITPGDRRPQLRRALGLAWVAFGCEGVAFSTYFSSGSADEVPSMSLAVAVALVLFFWPLSVVLLYGLLALSQWLWKVARRAGQPSLREVLALDPRAPVLFLRSFQDDQVALSAARVPLYLRVMDPGIVSHRFEELLIDSAATVGPVIAIGNPRDVRPPVGAGRQYFGAGQWQQHVLDHMRRARAIVVSLSLTEGLGWELDQIREQGYLSKVLFIVPPDLSRQPFHIRMRAARAGLELAAADLPARAGADDEPQRHVLACWQKGHGSDTVVCSSRPSELDYEIALRRFLAPLRGADAA